MVPEEVQPARRRHQSVPRPMRFALTARRRPILPFHPVTSRPRGGRTNGRPFVQPLLASTKPSRRCSLESGSAPPADRRGRGRALGPLPSRRLAFRSQRRATKPFASSMVRQRAPGAPRVALGPEVNGSARSRRRRGSAGCAGRSPPLLALSGLGPSRRSNRRPERSGLSGLMARRPKLQGSLRPLMDQLGEARSTDERDLRPPPSRVEDDPGGCGFHLAPGGRSAVPAGGLEHRPATSWRRTPCPPKGLHRGAWREISFHLQCCCVQRGMSLRAVSLRVRGAVVAR